MTDSPRGRGRRFSKPGTLGLDLPFFGVAMFVSLLIAVHATESIV
jgi:hypothetical protein